jgi:AcrR family transcriptional regulator
MKMSENAEKENPSQKILATAFECLASRGYANVSMRDIAGEAGVALSQLTYYYRNKQGLFTQVIDRMIRQYLHEIEDILTSAANPKERLALLVRYFKKLIREQPKLLMLFIDFTAQALWVPAFRKQVDELFDSITEMIETNILNGSENRESLHGHSSRSLAKLILGALYGTSVQVLLGFHQEEDMQAIHLAENLFQKECFE